jgi:BMFP domain-containing protein YqiC
MSEVEDGAADFDLGFGGTGEDGSPLPDENPDNYEPIEEEPTELSDAEVPEEDLEQELESDEDTPAQEETPTTQEEEPVEAAPTETDAPEAEEPPAEKFIFRGKEYDTIEDAEHAVSSWEGRINKAQSDYEDMSRWAANAYEENKSLNAKVADLEEKLNGVADEKAEADAAPKPKALSEAVEAEQLDAVMKAAEAQGFDPMQVGIQYATREIGKVFEERLDAKVAELEERAMAPHIEREAQDNTDQATQELFLWASKVKDEDGELVYPEFNENEGDQYDDRFVRSAHATWRNIAKENPEFAFGTGGIDYAVRLTREALGEAPAPEVPAKKTGAGAGVRRDAKGKFLKQNEAAAEAVSTTPGEGMSPDSTSGEVSEDTAMLKSWRESSKPVINDGFDLGFDSV